jgi:hypothetical protein
MARKKKPESAPEEAVQVHTETTQAEVTETKLISMVDVKQVMQFGFKLQSYIKANNLSVKIQNTEYAMVDGWKFAAMNFGIVPLVDEPERIETESPLLYVLEKTFTLKRKDGTTYDVMKPFLITTSKDLYEQHKPEAEQYRMQPYYAYKCGCKLISIQTREVVGSGFAICTNAESKKVSFDAYAVASMAQTRAIGKACRNLLGYIMKSAGYEPTPAEEMEEEQYHAEKKQAKENKTMPVKMSTESHEKITDLLMICDGLKLTDEDEASLTAIGKHLHTFTEERAKVCIKYLNDLINKNTEPA